MKIGEQVKHRINNAVDKTNNKDLEQRTREFLGDIVRIMNLLSISTDIINNYLRRW